VEGADLVCVGRLKGVLLRSRSFLLSFSICLNRWQPGELTCVAWSTSKEVWLAVSK